MRKELYNMICERLGALEDIKYIDLWNHNVEFVEQEEGWERPAVFVEFCPIEWKTIAHGVEYRAEPMIKLHIVTDWKGSAADGSEFKTEALKVFDLCEQIHEALCLMGGTTFKQFDLVGSLTSHNHEDILENIEVYQCVAFRKL